MHTIDVSVKTGEKYKEKVTAACSKPIDAALFDVGTFRIPLPLGDLHGIVRCYRVTLKQRYVFALTKPHSIKDKLKMFEEEKTLINAKMKNSEKLQYRWGKGKRNFMQTVVCLGMLLYSIQYKSPANIINEALITREEAIKRNANWQGLYHFDLEKICGRQMITHPQNFSKSTWNCLYVTHLHNPSMLTTHRYKPITILDNDKRTLWPLHFEKKRHGNRWQDKVR
ncbi:hypothetical protein G9A89_023204 [Geosiphon pyriformis]|nr:hypothetical protein G9A89_023204 [Geosiphon pyriformis]